MLDNAIESETEFKKSLSSSSAFPPNIASHMLESSTDERLKWLTAASEGQEAALEKLLDADRDYLMLIAEAELTSDLLVKVSGSDVVQESLLEAQQSFSAFRGQSEPQWRHWLRTILLNNIKDVRRRYIDAEKRSVRKEVDGLELDQESLKVADSPSQLAARDEQVRQLGQHIDCLPEHYQHVLHLRFWQQMDYARMAAETDSTPEAVRKTVYRAVEALVNVFKSQDQ